MLSVTVSDVVAVLSTYPPDAEVFLDLDTMHVHVEYDCYQMWDGVSAPENYHPIYLLDDWEV